MIKPSITKVDLESPLFLQRIQGDIYGPIQPPSGPFRYFMVLVDASCRWSHVCLLSTRNVTFARLLTQIIKLRAQFPDYPIKGIRMDNAGEFTSKSFDTYCASLGIEVEHPVAYVHTQNGLEESLIKHIKIIARTLLLITNLNDTAWGHVVLHVAALIRLRPTASLLQSPLQMVLGYEPDISHLLTFSCAVQLYRCLLHHQKERKWVPNAVWAFMLGLIHRPSLDSWNRLLVIILLPDSQIVISMRLCFH